jgi:hypothetical protein
LSDEDERTISHVEEFGCSVVSVKRTTHGLGWSYTVGVFDTCSKPEIITVGLQPDTAHFALNEAAKLLRAGVDLTTGRHRDLIGQVDCEFRPVDRKWVEQLMGWALWYYDGDDFPVVQAVYPDLLNRFPEDEEFDKSFEQPLMQSDTPMTRAENDFWASTDPNSSLFSWKFPDDPHTRVFLSETVKAEFKRRSVRVMAVNWRKIPISPTTDHPFVGEIAWFRQLCHCSPVGYFLTARCRFR